MLKRRNLKVLAAAIGVSVMSGFYASPVWADSSLKDTGDGSDTNTQVIVSDANGVFLKHQGNAESGKLVSEVVVGNEGVSMTHNGSQLVVNDNGVSFNSGQGQSLFTIGNDGALNATSLNVNGQTLSADELSELKSKTTALSYTGGSDDTVTSDDYTVVDSNLITEQGLIVQGNATVREQLNVEGQLVVQENATVRQQLNVEGELITQKDATVKGKLEVWKDLDVTGTIEGKEFKNADGTFKADTNGDVTANDIKANGDVNAIGTVQGKDFANSNNSFKVSDTGKITTTGGANITGGLTADTADITGNATVGRDLGVAGGAAVGGALSVGAGAVFGTTKGVQTAIDGNYIYAHNNDNARLVIEDVSLQNGTISYQDNYVINADGTAFFANKGFVIGKNGAFSAAENKFGVDKDGNARIGGSLNVKGAADFDANVNVDGKLDVGNGATFADKKVIIEDTGRTTFKSTQVEGETVINGGILRNETVMTQRVEVGDANGANTVTKDDGFYVKDKSDIVSKLNKDGLDVGKGNFTVDNNGNTKVGGTLDVTGATTLESTLNVKGNATFAANTQTNGTATFGTAANNHTVINGGQLDLVRGETRVGTNENGFYVGIGEDEAQTTAFSVDGNGVNAVVGTSKVGIHNGGTMFVNGATNDEYTNIDGDEITVTDGTNKTVVNSTDVSITDPLNTGNRINLSDLGQIDEVDDELADRMNADGVAPTAVNAIGTEAKIRREEVARLDNRIDKVEDRLDKVGAMTAAIANLRTMGYDPCAPSEFSMSLGHYRGETGMALGFFHYPNRDFMLSFSVSTAGDEYMGGIGATWKFGRKTPEQLAEEIKAKEAKKALVKAEAERKAAVAAKVRVQQAKHAEMQ